MLTKTIDNTSSAVKALKRETDKLVASLKGFVADLAPLTAQAAYS